MDFDDTALDDATYGRVPVEQVKAPAGDPAADQTVRQLAVLASLVEAGHDLALVMKTRAVYAAAEGKTDDKAAKAFALVAKTVQQVILLHQETASLREKRRASLLAERKARAKQIVRGAIDRKGTEGAVARTPQAEKERQVQRVKLDDLFRGLDDDIFEGLSVAELVERACRLFGVEPDPTLRWPEWGELRGESGPEPAGEPPPAQPSAAPAQAAPAKAKPVIPARFSGASALGLSGRAPPAPPPRERAPP